MARPSNRNRPEYPPAWSAERAFERELEALGAAQNGQRATLLKGAGFRIGQMLGRGGWIPESDEWFAQRVRETVYGAERDVFDEALAAGQLQADWSAAWHEYDVQRREAWLQVDSEARRRLRSAGWSEPQRLNLDLAEQPEPEHLGVGGFLLLPSLVWLFGEPETGKSLLAYDAGMLELRAGRAVVLFDAEAGESDIRQKFVALGVTAEQLTRLAVFDVAAADLRSNPDWALARFQESGARLAIFDSAPALLAVAGLDENVNAEVLPLIQLAFKPIRTAGGCVVITDHVTKSDSTSRYPRAAGAKLGEADLAYHVTAPEPFARGRSGRLRLRCTKDRSGWIGPGTQFDVYLTASDDGRVELDATRMTPTEAAILRSLEQKKPNPIFAGLEKGPQTVAQLQASTGLSRNRVAELLNQAKSAGLVVEGEHVGFAKTWRLAP
jgi:hypothetical protein